MPEGVSDALAADEALATASGTLAEGAGGVSATDAEGAAEVVVDSLRLRSQPKTSPTDIATQTREKFLMVSALARTRPPESDSRAPKGECLGAETAPTSILCVSEKHGLAEASRLSHALEADRARRRATPLRPSALTESHHLSRSLHPPAATLSPRKSRSPRRGSRRAS